MSEPLFSEIGGLCSITLVRLGGGRSGHVPAQEIKRMLKERPKALGLAVLGMPVGSPGMEVGDKKTKYDVLLVNKDGTSRVYQTYG